MKKSFKKMAAIALSVAIAATMMAVPAFAANPSTSNTMTIEKNLKVKNPTLTSVDGPGLKYTYAIAAEEPGASNGGATISDSQGHTATVHKGIDNGVTLSANSVEWPVGTAVNASAAGADNIKSITATADLSKFSSPGIYRYKLTETADPADPSSIGVTDDDPAEVRYIDVYIENGDNGLKVAGVVMHDGNLTQGKKTFDDSVYETVNVVLEKQVVGNMGDRDNQFPFSGTVSDNGRFFYAKKNTAPAASDATSTAFPSDLTLKHTEKFYISGLSKVATVSYKEKNNTSDTYNVAVGTAVNDGSLVAASDVAANGDKEMTAKTATDIPTVVFTNKFESVSPTGLAMRYGAYFVMLLAAAALVVFLRKTKSSDRA